MAKTWSKQRGNPLSRVDALAARRVLRDCYIAHQELSKAARGAQWRLRWVAVLTLLRAVGHVLKKVDGRRSIHMKGAIAEAWKQWMDAPSRNLIFTEFIEKERNLALKEYRLGETLVMSPGEHATHEVRLPMVFCGRLVGQVELVREAIDWWEVKLDEIEENALERQRAHRIAASETLNQRRPPSKTKGRG